METSFWSDLYAATAISTSLAKRLRCPRDLVYSYVKAVIVTEIYTLQLYLGDELVTSFDYRLRV